MVNATVNGRPSCCVINSAIQINFVISTAMLLLLLLCIKQFSFCHPKLKLNVYVGADKINNFPWKSMLIGLYFVSLATNGWKQMICILLNLTTDVKYVKNFTPHKQRKTLNFSTIISMLNGKCSSATSPPPPLSSKTHCIGSFVANRVLRLIIYNLKL